MLKRRVSWIKCDTSKMIHSVVNRKAEVRMNNEQLIREAREGDAGALDTLLHRFKKLVKAKAAPYYLIGGDRDDIIQEGMIGLYKAICDYDLDKPLPFFAFAQLCINRQIITAIKASARQKHAPLNMSLSLNARMDGDGENTAFMDTLAGGRANDPEALLIDREELNSIGSFLQQHLTPLEYNVFMLHLQGQNHSDIARRVDKNIKSVSNTLQRVRRKVDKMAELANP